MKVAVIGGGASGFFGAITCAKFNPDAEITILEKTPKLLAKVKISGGGRCNVTNACLDNNILSKNYPRGQKELKAMFSQFSPKHTMEWFEARGVKLKTEEEGKVFPQSDSSQTIIDCLIREARVMGVKIMNGFGVKKITKNEQENNFTLTMGGGETFIFDRILISTGGHNNLEGYKWLQDLGHNIVPPLPSLFTFNIPDSEFRDMPGISFPQAHIRVMGTNMEQIGPLLITHWGLSGPAVLKLSAWGARLLHESNYNFKILLNWIPGYNENSLRNKLMEIQAAFPKKIVSSNPSLNIPRRVWERLVELAEIPTGLRWVDVSKKSINKLLEGLIRSPLTIRGKTTFKEEFVTCGGIDLEEVNLETLESKKCPGIFFAGEVLNIDGITGGYNFQAAWTTGYIAGKGIATRI